MLEFQTAINLELPDGIPGEISHGVPYNGVALTVTSAGNKFGYAYTRTAGTDDKCVIGGTGEFAGILALSKSVASHNTVEDGANFTLAQNSVGNLVNVGAIKVDLANAGDIGDAVEFDQTTGQLYALAWGAAATAGRTIIRNAKIDYYNLAAAGVATIKIAGV